MCECEQKKGLFEMLTKTQAFVLGLIGAFLVMCTIGFFILLCLMLNGNSLSNNSAVKEDSSAPKKFSECVDSGKYASQVQADSQLGSSLGVQGTPATFINGYLVSGAMPYDVTKDVIDDLLAGRKPFIDNYKTYQMETGDLQKAEMPELEGAVWRGSPDAKVSLVEFSDFECPYCARFSTTIEQLINEYKDKIRFTYRHFPLSFHASAQKAAEAFECAKDQNKTWELYAKMFELSNASQLNLANIKKAAGEIGLK